MPAFRARAGRKLELYAHLPTIGMNHDGCARQTSRPKLEASGRTLSIAAPRHFADQTLEQDLDGELRSRRLGQKSGRRRSAMNRWAREGTQHRIEQLGRRWAGLELTILRAAFFEVLGDDPLLRRGGRVLVPAVGQPGGRGMVLVAAE